jgi:RHS repeat-associated protein
VTATGTAPLRYQWYFNGTNALAGATSASLTFSNVQVTNAGNYSVTVTNMAGSINSTQALLKVTVLFQFTNFCDTSLFQTNGNAAATSTSDGCVLELTPSAANQGGSAFLKIPVTLVSNASFSTFFSFRLSAGGGTADGDGDGIVGADGIVFVVKASTNTVNVFGGGEDYLGLTNSVGIEFDTWYNNGGGDADPQLPSGQTNPITGTTGDGNHVALDLNGDLSHTAYAHVADYMNNSNVWYAWIDYDGASNLQVRISETNSRPPNPVITNLVNLISYLHTSNSYVGFTAATGGSYNQQDILSWEFVSPYAPIGITNSPSVTIVSPTNEQFFIISPTNILLSATLTNFGGTLTNVSFYLGTNLLGNATGPDTNGFYDFVWQDAAAGTYSNITAHAADNLGASAISMAISIILNAAPIVRIITPTNLQSYLEVTNVTITAGVFDPDSGDSITNVVFNSNGTNLPFVVTQSGTNYSLIWSNLTAGAYPLTAVATDNHGASHPSSIRIFRVNPPSPPPLVAIIAPANYATFKPWPDVTITASAFSSAGITQVDFYNGTNYLGTDTTSDVTDNSTNFEITLHGLSPGTYSFTAKATDIASPNQTTISLPANITVQNSPKFPDPGFWDPVFGNFSVDPGRPDNPPALALQFDSQGNLFVGQEATTGESEGDGSFMIHADCSYWDSITSAGEGVFTSILLHGTNIYFGGESGFILWNGTTSIQIGDSLPGGDSSVCVEPISRTIKAIHAMNGDFYIGGNFTNSNIQFVAELVAGSTNWSAVATNRLNGSVWAIADFDNTLYIGGDFTAAGTNTSVQYLARLVNGDWQPVGSGVNARVCALTAHNGRLFVGGEFTVAGGLTNANLIACWDGTNWSSINNGLNNGVMPTSFSSEEVSTCFPTNRVSAIASRGDEIYVTGHFGTAWNGTNGITATNIARAFWDDTSQTWQWSALGNGLSYSDGTAAIGFAISIKDLSTSGSYEVIVGGAFGVAGETLSDTVARWIVGQPDCPTNGPSVFIDGSLDGSSPYVVPCGFPEDGIVQLNAQAFPTGAGMITNVNFYIDNNFVGSGYSYSEFFWQIEPTCTSLNLTPGIHIIQAVATDSAGLSAVSAPIQFNYTTCAGCFAGPTANPDNYYVISTNVTTSVTLSVLDNDTTNIYNTGTLQIVGLNTNQSSNPFESAPSAGGTFSIGLGGTNLIYNAGPYAFGVDVVTYAVADSTGTNSAVATVIVQPHSVIQIVQPTNGWTAYIPASFTVSGTTTNADTTINQVQFYVNNIAYGLPVIPDASGNFSLSWRSGRLGTNTFLAMATDHNNITSFSAPVTVYVTNNPSGSSGYNSPVAVIASPLPSRIGLAGAFVTNTLIVTDGFITNLAGSAFDTAGNTASWQILLLDANNPDASPINVTPGTLTGGFHVGGVTNASLGTVDLSTVENGAYILTLFVQSSAGVATASLNIALDSNLKLGQFSFSQQDLVIPVNGIPLTVTRTYDSQNQRSSDFGYGWTYSLNSMDVQLDEERQDWQVGSDALPIDLNDGDDGGGSGPIVSIRTGGSRDVTLTLPDGRRVTFQFYFTQAGYNFYAQWQAPPDVNYTLTAIGNPFFDGLIGYWNDIEGTSFDNYDFVSFVLQDKNSGTQYSITRGSGDDLYFDPAGDGNYIYTPVFGPPQLTQITQRNGATINISPSGIYYQDTNGVGRAVAFSRDSQNRIIEIYDPNAISNNGWPTLQYVYNHDSGNLVQVLKLVDGNAGTYVTNSFGYTNVTFPHFITSITNADGTQVAKNFYDDSGKLTAVQDANGNLTRFNYNTTNHIEQVVDRLGNTNTSVYDLSGNITVLTNGLGQITTMAYDTTNNKTNVVTYLNGQPYATNNYAYNPNNLLLSSTDPLGHTNGFVYDGNGDLLSSADAFGHVTVNTYDSSGNLTNTTDALQNSTVNFYDGNGLSRGSQDAVGTITTNYYDSSENLIATATVGTGGTILSSNTFAYDDNANRLTSTIWRKASGSWTAATTTYIYDAQNRVIQTIDPDGGTNTVVYDPTGRQNATIDKLGRATSYTYNALGQLIQTTYPDSTTETNGYDANGNRIASADRLNRVTTYVYDALNRLTQTIYADSTTNTSVYDDVGRVKFTIDARGITNAFGYDAAGRRLAVTNALGTTAQTISGYGYDANGNQLTFTDPNSHTTTNVFDALNRQVQVQYPDGTKTSTAYDADGRSVAQTNQDNLVTLFGYDGAGRLLSVTNALNQVTRYQYDEAGNQTAQIDALGRTNSFAYDGLGQRISHTMPMNSLVERFSYDLAGNMVLDTNFKSVIITNQYDAMNRLTNRASVGYNVSFAYSPTGQRTNMIDASGTNNYFYDNRDRLTNKAVAFANGPSVSLTYKYDANGNLTNLWSSTSGGVTNVYQYDALNRLTNVLGSGSTAANYNFDAVGNLQTIRYGNGVTNLYQYDSLNHLTNSTWKLTATTLASFYYQIGSTGNRTNLNEVVNGSNRGYSWKYDVLYRLTNETVSTTVPAGTLTYGYDAVGNRTNRSGSLGSLVSQTPTYNTNDWLNSDQYDANGNTTNSSGNFYQFDVMNHLTNVNSGSILMTYDGDGNRVSKKISGVTVYYLIDDKNPSGYIQVLEEYQGSTLSKVNNYGLSLISQRVPNTSTNYFIFDGHGSTRILTDIAGNFVNAFAYDAYGTLIASNGTPQTAYLYCCEPFDFDVGLYLNGARYLNPNTGRFWTMDSYEGDNEYPLSLHKYLYGADNPVNRIDPHGTSDMLIEFKGTNGAASKVDISWPHVADLTSQLNYAATNHLSITKLYFKGHGDDHDMYLEGGGVLTVSTWTGASEWIEVQNGRILAFQNGNTDITAQMRAVLGVGSVVILDGCHTGRGAGNICHDMSVVLPGVTVIGGRGYHLNVPFTHHTVGVINVYINGDLDGTFY